MRALRRLRPALGSLVEIGLASVADEGSAAVAIGAAYARIAEVERKLSFHSSDSELTLLNCSGGDWVPLSALSLRVLHLAQVVTRASNGLYNLTIGGAMLRRGLLPDHGSAWTTPLLDVGSADDVELRAGAARLRRPLRITLDGLAKGYAVDLAVRELRQHRVAAGWVNAGGDLRVFGELSLPISRRDGDGRPVPLGGLRNAAIASSGAGGVLAARQAGVVLAADGSALADGEWSVIAHRAWLADALTKVAAQCTRAQRLQWLPRLGGRWVEAAAVQLGDAA